MKFNRKLALTTAGAVAAVSLVGGGVAFAAASQATGSTASGTTSGSQAQAATDGAQDPGMAGGMRGGHAHTPVTGDELTQVTEAIAAYDSAITVESVEKDEDGTYDVHGTKDGVPVQLDVSADLASITEGMGGPGGGMGGPPPEGLSGAPGEDTSGTTSSNPADANGTT